MPTTLSPQDADQLRAYERDRHNALAEGYIGFFAPVTALAIAPLLEAVRLEPGMKLLDVPTGSGALAAEATRRGASVIGIDIAPGMITQAKKLHPGIDFRVGDVEHLPMRGWRARRRRLRLRTRAFSLPRSFRRRVPAHAEAGRAHRVRLVGHFGQAAHPGPIRDAVAEVGAKPPPVLPKGHSSLRFSNPAEFTPSPGRGRARRCHAQTCARIWCLTRTRSGTALSGHGAHLIPDRAPGRANAGGNPRGAGAAGCRLQDAQGIGAADRLQSWSGAETGLSVPPRLAAFRRSAVTGP